MFVINIYLVDIYFIKDNIFVKQFIVYDCALRSLVNHASSACTFMSVNKYIHLGNRFLL